VHDNNLVGCEKAICNIEEAAAKDSFVALPHPTLSPKERAFYHQRFLIFRPFVRSLQLDFSPEAEAGA